MIWTDSILADYLIVVGIMLVLTPAVATCPAWPGCGDDGFYQKSFARCVLAAIAWPLVIPAALLYVVLRIPGWMVKLVKTADLPPLRTKEKK